MTGMVLSLCDNCIGCTLAVVSNGVAYNLQMGFQDGIDKRISTGYVLLGYAIEYYCKNPGITSYDLLPGRGKKSNYKERIAVSTANLESVQIICSFKYKILYKINDFLRHREDSDTA